MKDRPIGASDHRGIGKSKHLDVTRVVTHSSSSRNFGFAVLEAKANSREAGMFFDLFGEFL